MPDMTESPLRPAAIADRATVQVADVDGRLTRIRVAVLGNQVRAVISPPDSEAARQLVSRMDELQAALAKQGFADPRITVQGAEPDRSTVMPLGAPSPVAGPTANSTSRGTEQPPGDQRQGSGQQGQQRGGSRQNPQQRSHQRDPEDRGR
ncbi:MAG TPA: hypothetical protein VEI47_08545 [Gemmatimonadales bacterium]|jgi:hypothetical protein|nr:hypothetical protein [Gemmatimonadales bacterium]